MMWTQPHFIFRFETEMDPTVLEQQVPGVLVYGYLEGRHRVIKHEEPQRFREYELYVPLHAGWLVEAVLIASQITYSAEPRYMRRDVISPWDNCKRPEYEAVGRQLISRNTKLKPHVADLVTPYQAMGVAWASQRPYVFNVWACGSGKTLGAILASFTRTGPTLVLCPAKARHVWWSQVQEYTTIIPHRVRPRGERKVEDETLAEYLERMGSDAFVVVGAESIHEYLDEIYMTQPAVFIFDEMHLHGSSKRWKAVHKEDGTVDFEKKTTKANKHTRAVAVMDVSRMPSIKLRIALTATPLDDGRPRRMWSQLDLLSPGGFSHSYRNFAYRYCDAQQGQYGGIDDRGSSNLDELRDRCSFFTHEVPYNESHASLPSTRVQVVYLERGDLNGASRFSDEQTYHQAIRALTKEARHNYVARTSLTEARLAEACSKKRNYVVDEVKQGIRSNGKVVVFVARRNEAEVWAHRVRQAITTGDEKTDVQVWMAHGGISETERDRITDAYRDHPGPCVLIATGQSVGTGVDGMQTTDLAIFAMLPWRPGDFTQWKGRFDRLGGRPTLLKVVIATGTYDERVVEILVDKFGPIETFLAADELRGLDSKLLGLEETDHLVDSMVNTLGGFSELD
jgi:superfamily II DNA or RNA helicase